MFLLFCVLVLEGYGIPVWFWYALFFLEWFGSLDGFGCFFFLEWFGSLDGFGCFFGLEFLKFFLGVGGGVF